MASSPVTMKLLPTTVVGSYPQPGWLVDRALLSKGVPRVNMHELWRIPPEHLREAQDDATRLAIRDMERAGIDIITDGEIRRESYSNYFVADRQARCIVLRFTQMLGRYAPEFMHIDARHALREQRAVHQPAGLRIASYYGGGEKFHCHW